MFQTLLLRTVENLSDTRFDPNYAAQLLLDIAHEQSLEQLLCKLVDRVSERPNMACTQIWLLQDVEPCRDYAAEGERPRLLRMVSGKGNSISEPGQLAAGFDDPNQTIPVPLGVGLLGRVAATGEQVLLHEQEFRREDLVGMQWVEQEQIKSIGMTPIVFKGEVLGVIAGYSRRSVPAEARPWGRIFADHIGAAIANARAFEEIQRLKAQLEQRNSYLMEEVVEAKGFGDMVGQSGALRQVISQIDLVAPTEAAVLILGETGTGKGLVVHEIHKRSGRKNGPLVRVNCASIPRDLFESEFFGHVRGAFTGAVKDRAGRFETAHGGTLFLDEVGEVPTDMQSKLLRVLQEKRYERVGEDRTRSADVRIVGATNRDLKQAVAQGRFREDLYYRLHVFPIHVAPLRERKDDIPLLANHFVETSARELKCAKPRLTRAGVIRLQAYDWPGNVRELRNVIERAVILARGGTLEFDLPANASPGNQPRPAPRPAFPAERGAREFLTEAEMEAQIRENLRAVLNKANWRLKGHGGAAELLGVKPTTLFSRMKKLGLQPPPGEHTPAEVL